MKFTYFATLIISVFLTHTAQAQMNNALSLSYEQNAETKSDGTQPKTLGLTYNPTYSVNDFKFSAKLAYGYDAAAPSTGNDWEDGVFNISTSKFKPFKAVKITPMLGVELPFSKESRVNRGINYITDAGVTLALDSKYLNIEDFSLSYQIMYGYLQNDYTTRVNGEPATQSKVIQSVATGYSIKPVTFSLFFQFVSNFSYDNVVRNGFLHVESVTYTVNDTLSFSLYHFNKASLLKAKTYENNLKAYDQESSTLGLSTDLSF